MTRAFRKTTELGVLLALAACSPVEPAHVQARSESPATARAEALADELERSATRVAELEAQLAVERARVVALEDGTTHRQLTARIEGLRSELAASEERRIAREQEWLAYTSAVTALELESLPDELEFAAEVQSAPEPEPEPSVAEEDLARIQREGELHRSLRALLAVEEVRGLDLLESGVLGEGWMGPVVFRLLDPDGRLAGSLWAERLRLEGSRAARTLTLVLEDGYETRGGQRVDFAQSTGRPTRRIVLPHVDPTRWVEALPELFAGVRLDEPIDDGRWNHSLVRGELNELLRRDAAGGWYRLKSFGGVMSGVLRDVHLEHLDREGRVERHLFADRLRVERREQGVVLLLEDGAQLRGEEKAAFLDGRFPIYLPRAKIEDWERAAIPGLSPPPSDDPGG